MGNDVPRVSIVLPTRNRARLLDASIASIEAQTMPDWELIVVDDASDDGTAEQVLARRDGRIRVLRLARRRGAPAARNAGIQAARAPLVAFQDSDDLWQPTKLARQLDVLERVPEVGIVYCQWWREDGARRDLLPAADGGRRIEGDLREELLRGNLITTPAAVVRRGLLDEYGGFDETLERLQDWELWIRLAEHTRFALVRTPLVTSRLQPDSISRDEAAYARAMAQILAKHRAAFGRLGRSTLAGLHYTVAWKLLRARELPTGLRSLGQGLRMNPLHIPAIPLHRAGGVREEPFAWRRRCQCPVCGSRLRSFAPAGDPPRPDALCPSCGSLERHRLLWLLLRRRGLLREGLRILHLAPEPAVERAVRRLPGTSYLSVDIQPGRAQVRADLSALPLADASLDAVLCSHVLEHVPDDLQALRELRRALRPGGWAAIQVPIDLGRADTDEDPAVTGPQERRRRFGQEDHLRLYGRDAADRMSRAGFAVDVVDLATDVGPELRRRHGLMQGEPVFLCRAGPAGTPGA